MSERAAAANSTVAFSIPGSVLKGVLAIVVFGWGFRFCAPSVGMRSSTAMIVTRAAVRVGYDAACAIGRVDRAKGTWPMFGDMDRRGISVDFDRVAIIFSSGR
jgi:hypothetical protein